MVSPTVITPQPCEMRFMRPRSPPTVGAYDTRGWVGVRLLLQMCLLLPSLYPSLLSRLRNHNQVDIDVLDARWREREARERKETGYSVSQEEQPTSHHNVWRVRWDK